MKSKTTIRESCRVVKTLLPAQPGTLKLQRRYGDALLCVRYREDAGGTTRYTIVELVVDSAPRAKTLDGPNDRGRANRLGRSHA